MTFLTQTGDATILPGIRASLGQNLRRFFAGLGRALTTNAAMDARMHRVAVLNAKTDAELSAMNLRRADIPAYVFRDLMHL
jgi:hypothetical protein